jgi:hypothetical protein
MSLGNVWLGSMQVVENTKTQALATNSFVLGTPVLSVASVVDCVVVNIPSATQEMFYISMTPAAGTSYSTVIYSSTTTGVTNVFYQPERSLFLTPGAYVTVRATNTGVSGTINGAIVQLY